MTGNIVVANVSNGLVAVELVNIGEASLSNISVHFTLEAECDTHVVVVTNGNGEAALTNYRIAHGSAKNSSGHVNLSTIAYAINEVVEGNYGTLLGQRIVATEYIVVQSYGGGVLAIVTLGQIVNNGVTVHVDHNELVNILLGFNRIEPCDHASKLISKRTATSHTYHCQYCYLTSTEEEHTLSLGKCTFCNSFILKDGSDNTFNLSYGTGHADHVILADRLLYKDGNWNTLCLPFGLTADQLDASPLAGFSELRTLSESMYNETSGTLTLNFTPATGDDAVTSIEAGTPYIIKWANTSETIEDPIFTGVTISNATTPVETNCVDFVGTYSPIDIFTEDKTNLYLGADNLLYYPSGEDMTSFTINSFRAYFQLKNGLTAGVPISPEQHPIKAFQLNFGDEETGILEITTPSNLSDLSNPSNLFLTLDGRRLSTRPVTPGIYINRGRKVVIK